MSKRRSEHQGLHRAIMSIVAISFGATILSLVFVTLFAGKIGGPLRHEELAIVRFDMTALSHNSKSHHDRSLVGKIGDVGKGIVEGTHGDSSHDDSKQDTKPESDDDLKDNSKDDSKDDSSDKSKKKSNDGSEEINKNDSKAIDIAQWYSIHVTRSCQGTYSHGHPVVTNCTSWDSMTEDMFTAVMLQYLDIGSLKLLPKKLSKMLSPQQWSEKLGNIAKKVLTTILILHACTVAFATVAVLGAFFPVIWDGKVNLRLIPLTFTLFSLLCLCIETAVMQDVAERGVALINEKQEIINMSATLGKRFFSCNWAAVGLLAAYAAFWMVDLLTLLSKSHKDKARVD